jgi:hypothetical protein
VNGEWTQRVRFEQLDSTVKVMENCRVQIRLHEHFTLMIPYEYYGNKTNGHRRLTL